MLKTSFRPGCSKRSRCKAARRVPIRRMGAGARRTQPVRRSAARARQRRRWAFFSSLLDPAAGICPGSEAVRDRVGKASQHRPTSPRSSRMATMLPEPVFMCLRESRPGRLARPRCPSTCPLRRVSRSGSGGGGPRMEWTAQWPTGGEASGCARLMMAARKSMWRGMSFDLEGG